jgi:hypothetical protein
MGPVPECRDLGPHRVHTRRATGADGHLRAGRRKTQGNGAANAAAAAGHHHALVAEVE